MEDRKRAYTVAEAAEVLGVSGWLVREAVRRGELHSARIGNRIIIPAAAIEKFLALPDDHEAHNESRPNNTATD